MENKFFTTESPNLTAWIKSHGQELIGNTTIENKTLFMFNNCKEVINLVERYKSNKELKDFIYAFSEVKKIMIQNKINKGRK